MKIFLYNPYSQNKKNHDLYERVHQKYADYNFYSVIDTDVRTLYESLGYNDSVIIAGGDGTINHFVNNINGLDLKANIYLYAIGTGNDFYKDLDSNEELVLINEYISNLPTVNVNDNEYKYINNCGLGLDGYVCHLVNISKNKNKTSFFKAAVKGFITFKKRRAVIFIDGKRYEFKNVFLASVLEGKYCGSGMMMAPLAKRKDGLIDLCVIHNLSRLRILLLFKSIYKGKHIKYDRYVFYKQAKKISMQFDQKTYFQMDGEVIEGINKIDIKI